MWFSRDVIAAMVMVENKRFLISSFCSSTSNIDICVPRDWLETTHYMITTIKKMGSIRSDRAVPAPIRPTLTTAGTSSATGRERQMAT